MTTETMRIRNAVNIPKPEAKKEISGKSAFKEILSTTIERNAPEKKELKREKSEEEKDMEVTRDNPEQEEEMAAMNLFPEMKPETQAPLKEIHEQAAAGIVEEAESAVDKSQTEKNPVSALTGRTREEMIALKDHLEARNPKLIDIPEDQGKTGILAENVMKTVEGKTEEFADTLKNIHQQEKPEELTGYKKSEVSDPTGKLQKETADEAAAMETLKEREASGTNPRLNADVEETRESEKGFMNLNGKEPVKQAHTSSEESGMLTETVNPNHEMKLREFQETSQTKTPEHINFEKTFENAAEEIMKTVETIREGDRTTMKVNLHPEEMGKMEITLTMEDGKLSGKILLENREIRQIFTERLDELSNSLKQNIQIGKFEVGVGDRGEGNQQRHQGQRQMQNPFRGYQVRKAETTDYGMTNPERNLKEINLLA
ncbi:flagellar hook-length control protein FliK [Proteiniclasticum sp. C24MP]|uniref:flagellar hook-length control protein FliK n=1 Tax=Proteiniclasticum sp. C24MP TaxID=3374101 RepID=UPI0037550970